MATLPSSIDYFFEVLKCCPKLATTALLSPSPSSIWHCRAKGIDLAILKMHILRSTFWIDALSQLVAAFDDTIGVYKVCWRLVSQIIPLQLRWKARAKPGQGQICGRVQDQAGQGVMRAEGGTPRIVPERRRLDWGFIVAVNERDRRIRQQWFACQRGWLLRGGPGQVEMARRQDHWPQSYSSPSSERPEAWHGQGERASMRQRWQKLS